MSRHLTNHRSSFLLGPLECRNNNNDNNDDSDNNNNNNNDNNGVASHDVGTSGSTSAAADVGADVGSGNNEAGKDAVGYRSGLVKPSVVPPSPSRSFMDIILKSVPTTQVLVSLNRLDQSFQFITDDKAHNIDGETKRKQAILLFSDFLVKRLKDVNSN